MRLLAIPRAAAGRTQRPHDVKQLLEFSPNRFSHPYHHQQRTTNHQLPTTNRGVC
jgi:hypothetical protein